MVNSRSKGQRGEREFIAILQKAVNDVLGDKAFELHRNLDQTRDGGSDVEGAPKKFDFCAFEIKRQEKLELSKWWKQAVKQSKEAAPSGALFRMPVLAYKQSRKSWRIITTVMINSRLSSVRWKAQAVISLEDFLTWYRLSLREAME